MAHVNRVWGLLRTRQKRWTEAQNALLAARRYFEEASEIGEVAKTLFAIAMTSAAAGEPRPLVSHAFGEALAAAESCRRAHLIRKIEQQLEINDPAAYCRWIYRRVRGRSVTEDSVSLIDGIRESATILFLDLQGSTSLSRFRDPGEMMMTLNEMMGNLSAVLRRHNGVVVGFHGDGFMALFRGPQNAVRGVEAALDLYAAMDAINEPREILGLPILVARVGVNSGDVFLGNVGTYDKLDFGAVGNSVNLAARLESNAEPKFPCIGRATHDQVMRLFTFTATSPRTVELKGLGPTQVWDVAGHATTAFAPITSPTPQPAMESLTIANQQALQELASRVKSPPKQFVFRRVNPTMWEFAFESAETIAVGKNLAGFSYLAVMLREPEKEFRPVDLLNQGRGLVRSEVDAVEADHAAGNEDRLDGLAMKEYRKQITKLKAHLAEKSDPAKQKELEFIESQLRAATKPGGKKVAAGSERLKNDYNAAKKAIDNALATLTDHKLVALVTHLSSHIELSLKSCRYRDSARIGWSLD